MNKLYKVYKNELAYCKIIFIFGWDEEQILNPICDVIIVEYD